MENVFSNFIGIDVSKDKIDVYSTETKQHFVVGNTAREIRHALFRGFSRENTLVVIENTGGYERICIETLARLGFQIHRANNNSVKHFCKYKKVKAKTDKVDAYMLALYGATENLAIYKPLTGNQEMLRQLAFFTGNVKRFSAGMKNRYKSPGCEQIHNFCKRIIDFMKHEIKSLEKEIEEYVLQDEETKQKYELLCEYKGVGKVTAMELIAFLPELGSIHKKGIASMAGLAPIANDSGQKKGYKNHQRRRKSSCKACYVLGCFECCKVQQNIVRVLHQENKRRKKENGSDDSLHEKNAYTPKRHNQKRLHNSLKYPLQSCIKEYEEIRLITLL